MTKSALTLLAVTAISLGVKPGTTTEDGKPKKAPTVKDVLPGETFVAANKAQFEELIACGAATVPEDSEDEVPAKKKAPAKKKKAPAKKKTEPKTGDGETGSGDGETGDGEGVL